MVNYNNDDYNGDDCYKNVPKKERQFYPERDIRTKLYCFFLLTIEVYLLKELALKLIKWHMC